MFVTVKYGADNQIILNPNCKVINLAEVLREKCQCGNEVLLDLLDESGNLVNLCELEGSQDVATNYLKERQCYILVKIIRGDGSEPARYESLLENLWKCHPELAERLQKLSNPHVREKGRNAIGKKPRSFKETSSASPAKPRTTSQQRGRPA
ncbi:uncharacterized protein C22orf15 homolog [Gastrophryne carolinensis]